ncbi:TdiD protein [Lentinula aciculospora]|uniref:TdiD protein n=1 Tax=Lentinula aciculospora TaxID=153920 RepID=A0A9W9DR24_9AGAR|nr:TdiD protein [Lentinula aciculospora]
MTNLKSSPGTNVNENSTRTIVPNEIYHNMLSSLSKSRKPAPIRHLFPYEHEPGMISMLAGKPNPSVFPFVSLTMEVRSPNPQINDSLTDLRLDGQDLAAALQYGPTSGNPALVKWLTDLTCHLHGSQLNEGWRVTVGSGSQDLLYKAFSALVEAGDAIFLESPTYPGVLPIVQALGCNIIQIPSDADGIDPSSIVSLLADWPKDKPCPKLLYTIPFGSNPTGSTTTPVRRLEVLRLARLYNFIILEDDPYYHLYYGDMPRPASYFALERKVGGELGRVLRFDSFSKIVAGGLRLGWATGPEALVSAIDLHGSSSNLQASGMSQMLVLKLLRHWGIEGFLAHTAMCAQFYGEKRNLFEKYLQRHLKGLAEWSTPNASMFYWIKLYLPVSMKVENIKEDEGDSLLFLTEKAIPGGIIVLPGECAYADERRICTVRVSFSLLDEADMDEGLRRLGILLRE